MGHEPENLLENHRIEDVLEDVPSSAPVVVVQGRNRSFAWLLIVGSIVAIALGSAYAYYRREFARLNAETELARRDYLRALEQARDEENERRLAAMPTPADPPQRLAVASDPAPTPSPPSPSPSAVVATVAGLPEKAVAVAASAVAAPAPAVVPPDVSPFDALNEGQSGAATAPVDLAAAPASATAGEKTKPAPPPSMPAPAPAPAPAPVGPVPADQPLPSREETERRIRAEAAEIGRGADQKREQQREELQALRVDERRQFIDELRMILKVQGRAAGQEIERLYNRSGRSNDPKMLKHARSVISETRASRRAKVGRLRDMGVPETVILDYLTNAMERNLNSRNGPRTRNEIWIKAGELLVKYYDESRPAGGRAGAAAR